MRTRIAVIGFFAFFASPFVARAAEMKLALIKPGAGFLTSDGTSVIALEIVVSRAREPIKTAKIAAKLGRITATKVLSTDRVGFYYAAPKRTQELNEVFDATLSFPSGEHAETFPVRIGPMQGPSLDILVEPSVIDATSKDKRKVTLAATAEGRNLVGLVSAAQPGSMPAFQVTAIDGSLRGLGTLEDADIPLDQPSYVLFLTAAASANGFVGKAAGVTVEAPIRISVELPPKAVLSIEGSSNSIPTVTAPADGKTVVENVVVRYGAPVHAFTKKNGKKREVPIVIPTALQSGLTISIPGQTVADGGTGPTVLVAVPPSPFGGEPIWPDVKIEGADVVHTMKLAQDLHALVVRRPDTPMKATVLLDDQPAGTIDFISMVGESLEVMNGFPKNGERGAVELRVKDVLGRLTDHPVPKARIDGGRELKLEHLGVGRYRAPIALGTDGAKDKANVIAELAAPETLGGDPIDPARQVIAIPLTGIAAVVAASPDESAKAPVAPPPVQEPEEEVGAKFGISLAALLGTSFSSLLTVGGGLLGELRLPFLEQRLALRAGALFSYASGSGKVSTPIIADTRTVIAGVLVPVDVGFAVVHLDSFELLIRGGASVRFETGGVQVQGTGPGAGSRVGLGGNVGMDADIAIGSGALLLGATLDGIGATADGLSKTNPTTGLSSKITGPLINVRAEVGYRFWF